MYLNKKKSLKMVTKDWIYKFEAKRKNLNLYTYLMENLSFLALIFLPLTSSGL